MKKILNALYNLIKILYLIVGSMLILPLAAIIVVVDKLYNYAKTIIQTTFRK